MSNFARNAKPKLPCHAKAVPTPESPYGHAPPASAPYLVEVTPGLFMGDAVTSRNLELLLAHNIGVVINLCFHKCDSPFKDRLRYYEYQLPDHGDYEIMKHFDEIGGIIERELHSGARVLVHCQKGLSRAPTIVLAFLISFHRMSYDEAFAFLQAKRPDINPILNYTIDLTTYALQHRQTR